MPDSVSERAAAGQHTDPDPDGELFPMGSLQGDGVTLKTLIKSGKDNNLTVSIAKAEVPSGSGLADPEKDRTLLVTCEPGKVTVVPLKEEGKVVGYKTRQSYRPVFVEAVQRGDAGRLEAGFKQLLLDDSKGAVRALDAMQAVASAELVLGD